AEADRRARRVQRRRVLQRPHDELVGGAAPGGAGDRLLRLVGGIRAQEVLGAVVREVELRRPGRLCGPEREAPLRRTRLGPGADHAGGVDVLHRHARGARGELRLRQRIDLRPAEPVFVPRIRVGREVDPVRVGADVWVVAEIRPRVLAAGIRAVVGDVDPVYVPATRWVACLAHRQVEVVHAGEDTLAWTTDLRFERQGEDEE